jgi:asparagine synthetase B (glutamine-hydrolysing)
MTPAFVRRVKLRDWMNTRAEARASRRFTGVAQRAFEQRLCSSGGYAFAFEEDDRLFRSSGIESRSPFVDVRLVELAAALPADQRRWRGHDRVALRSSMRGTLPEQIRTRHTKADFSGFIDREIATRQRPYITALFANSKLAEAGVVDRANLTRLWEDYTSAAGGAARWQVLSLLNAERWLRHATGDKEWVG